MNTVADPGLRLPGTFHLPRGNEPLNQRIASEIEQQLAVQFEKETIIRMFVSGYQAREVVIHHFLELLLYAFRTEQLKAEPSFKQLRFSELAALDALVIATVNKSYQSGLAGFTSWYDAEILVLRIIQAYAKHGYIIRES